MHAALCRLALFLNGARDRLTVQGLLLRQSLTPARATSCAERKLENLLVGVRVGSFPACGPFANRYYLFRGVSCLCRTETKGRPASDHRMEFAVSQPNKFVAVDRPQHTVQNICSESSYG